jgi:hypothetical protein
MKLEIKKFLYDIKESIESIENYLGEKGISIYILQIKCFVER